ncbi:unnamed protein product [Owenia fusiformis]|uniref:Uncharacterized protein n=1 Tax=Owenia fusiformis TaxID=6347 RepID=A0A8J1UAK9_OWEFU|nr:unnamed protein product [Owenia fusiformis]
MTSLLHFLRIFVMITVSLIILTICIYVKMERQLVMSTIFKTLRQFGKTSIHEQKNNAEQSIGRFWREEIKINQMENEFVTDNPGHHTEKTNSTENVNDQEMALKTNWTFKYLYIKELVNEEKSRSRCHGENYEMLIYEQVRHMLENREAILNNDLDALTDFKEYGYSVQWELQENYDVIVILQETYRGVLSKGGSSFRIMVEGVHKYLCNIKDYFNGTYHVCCPNAPPCSNIEIIQMYTNFGAFNEITPLYPSLGVIANIALCEMETQRDLESFVEFMNKTIICNDDPGFMSRNGRWIQVNGTYKWGLHEDCLLEFISEKQANHCFKSLNSVMCSGQSHLRHTMVYFSALAGGKFPREKFKDWGFEHLHFLWTPKTKNIKTDITRYINETLSTRNQRDIVIIEGGPWDLRNLPLLEYWHTIKELIIPSIKSMRQTTLCGNVRFIWLNNVAFPHKPAFLFREYHKRSDFRAAAVNGLIYDLTRELNIDIIDHLMASSPRSIENVCGHHYLCPSNFSKPTEIEGDVGKTVAQMLFRQMCQSYLD